jgi:hypothetical protein
LDVLISLVSTKFRFASNANEFIVVDVIREYG